MLFFTAIPVSLPPRLPMSDTIFDKIIRREIPADIVYEDDEMLAFRDVNPQAPVHVLFIPKRRIATLNDLQADDGALVGRLFATAVRWAKDQGFADDGYRLSLIHISEPTRLLSM